MLVGEPDGLVDQDRALDGPLGIQDEVGLLSNVRVHCTHITAIVKHDAVDEDIKLGINQEVLFAHVVILGHLEANFQQAPDLGNKPVVGRQVFQHVHALCIKEVIKGLVPRAFIRAERHRDFLCAEVGACARLRRPIITLIGLRGSGRGGTVAGTEAMAAEGVMVESTRGSEEPFLGRGSDIGAG